jgi:SLOG in TRPM, prokaryote
MRCLDFTLFAICGKVREEGCHEPYAAWDDQMSVHLITASAIAASMLLIALRAPSRVQTNAPIIRPRVLEVSSVGPEKNAQLLSLIAEIRGQADALVFLSGGASRMREDHQRRLMAIFEALTLVAKGGRRIAVGDGGTQAGIMEAAGHARRASGNAFPLIGVAPAREIPPRGKTPIDPNHSHVVAVDNPSAPAQDSWGSETDTMYWLFAKLAEGRPSVTIVANGGGITLTEVESNVRAGRRIILIEGSGRAADALVSLLQKTQVSDAEVVGLRARAEKAALTRRPELFQIVALRAGPTRLRDAITAAIGPTQ